MYDKEELENHTSCKFTFGFFFWFVFFFLIEEMSSGSDFEIELLDYP